MSKAILVMDMPKDCCICVFNNHTGRCKVTGKYCNAYHHEGGLTGRPNWCPLKPMPNKKSTEYNPCRNPYIAEGYNSCIDEILGGSEE